MLVIIRAIRQFNSDVTCLQYVPKTDEFDFVRFKSGHGESPFGYVSALELERVLIENRVRIFVLRLMKQNNNAHIFGADENIAYLRCHSSIGRDGGEQTITIGPQCHYVGVVMHEMNHAAGFFHEQNRWDRDKYITVHWNNIQAGKEYDFNIQNEHVLNTLGSPYDYGSIMHYGRYIFAKDWSKPTITPKFDPQGVMGQRHGFSELDVWKINTLYGCETGSPPLPQWMQKMPGSYKTETSTLLPSTTSGVLDTSKFTLTTVTTTGPALRPGKPTVRVTVFPNALRISWDRPDSSEPIRAYILTHKLEPDGHAHVLHVAPNRLTYYLSTYTSHPGRRYTVSVAAETATNRGPELDHVTVRSACSHSLYLDNDSYDKIHSPFFKNGYYEQDVICEWKISSPSKQSINLTFSALNISGDDTCSGDFVRVGTKQLFCNVPPPSNHIVVTGNDVTVTFMSKPGNERKLGGFLMTASAQSYSPVNVHIEHLATAFNISWEPPAATPSPIIGYVISYKLTSESVARQTMVAPTTTYFLLATYPHFGVIYNIELSTVFTTGKSDPSGPFHERTGCHRNITVIAGGKHLNSPHYPRQYEPETICDWLITAPPGRQIVLAFQDMDLQTGDHVDIVTDDGSALRIDSANQRPQSLITGGATVQFVSDAYKEGNGFRINLNLL